MQPYKRHEKKYYKIFTEIFLEVDPQEDEGKTKSTTAVWYRGCEERRDLVRLNFVPGKPLDHSMSQMFVYTTQKIQTTANI